MATEDLTLYEKPQTAIEIRAHVNLIQEVMQAVMKENTHYGIIPGCKKPSLWKPGAEVLFTTFRISVDPIVEDLSTPDEARFRVTARATSSSGTQLGSALGEASSNEEKYQWREVVCSEEWDATPLDSRRTKWKNGSRGPYSVDQVRTNIADSRNTVLKMAAKRASVALALQVTAASDIFTQDIEDLPEEVQAAAINGDAEPPAPLPVAIKKKEAVAPTQTETKTCGFGHPVHWVQASKSWQHVNPADYKQCAERENQRAQAQPVRQTAPAPRPPVQSPKPASERIISEAQSRRFYAIRKGHNRTDEETKAYLREVCGVSDSREMPAKFYEQACKWAEGDF